MTRRVLVLAVIGSLLLAVTPSSAGALPKAPPEPDYFVDEGSLPFGSVAGHEDSDRRWGIHNNAGYRIEVPSDWNGELVMWAHGFRGDGARLFFNPNEMHPAFRTWLLDNGYAWSASTYSKNGYNVAQGVKDTHALSKFFNGEVARPDRVYIAGASMGGHITAVSAEKFPRTYAGAMPVCGVLGDYELFDFFLDFNLAAQQIALGTSMFPVENPAFYVGATAQQIKAELELAEGTWPVALNSDGEAFKQLVELRSGGDRPNFDEAWFFWNSFPEFGSGIPGNFLFDLGALDGTNPGRPGVGVDNSDVVYQVDLDPAISDYEADLNDSIFRVTHDPSARNKNGLSNVPVTTGDLRIPMLTMHNLGDLFVPFHNEIVYAERVEAKGNSEFLVQRAIRGVNHCGFTGDEYIDGFTDLVTWVEDGVRPAGDEMLDPAAVAADDFGCEFTDFATPGGHLFAADCSP